jgi:hypothetical protein|tara:strand:- start:667 stop:1071 length:405 start_codon:yes stop_codon:yes gene_type:complete
MTAPTGDAVLAELKKITAQLVKQNQTQDKLLKSVQNLEYLVNGYTSGGASFNGYLPDSFLTAYISILGPALSQKMAVGESDLEEMMKGATILAKRLLEELAAYRTEQEGTDVLKEALSFLKDPWNQQEADNGQN